jgi:hypothetical protein
MSPPGDNVTPRGQSSARGGQLRPWGYFLEESRANREYHPQGIISHLGDKVLPWADNFAPWATF